jgi:hypothetical protein
LITLFPSSARIEAPTFIRLGHSKYPLSSNISESLFALFA